MISTEGALRPPLWPVGLEVLAVLAAAAIVLLNWNLTIWWQCVIGYFLGAVAAVVCAAVYRAIRAARRSKNFRASPALDGAVTILMILGVVVGIACAFLLATEVAKW